MKKLLFTTLLLFSSCSYALTLVEAGMGDSCDSLLRGFKEEGFDPVLKNDGEIFIGKEYFGKEGHLKIQCFNDIGLYDVVFFTTEVEFERAKILFRKIYNVSAEALGSPDALLTEIANNPPNPYSRRKKGEKVFCWNRLYKETSLEIGKNRDHWYVKFATGDESQC
ncbi:hypothetical protein [Microbulbifer sp. JTAC008]|uniref:hypothetical protein n=1 Tax=unclassified Microbulbifer TaxID=2619833 RepID=UPI00403A54B9